MSEPFQYEHEQLARLENGRIPIFLTKAQYNRAKACWNACAGMPNNILSTYASGIAETVKAAQQRDELLELCLAIQNGQTFDEEFCKRFDEVIARCQA